jgi:hypothetical protein
MLGLRAARVRAMIARGEVPVGYRVNDEGTGFVPTGNPAWPVRPLDRHCTQYGEPSLELLVLIREVLPDFDPERDPRGWLDVVELVRRTGRPAAEVEAMGHDELVAFFRHEVFDRRRSPSEVERASTAATEPAPPAATVTPGAAAAGGTPPEKSTSEILREWLDDPKKRVQLVSTLSSEKAGTLIGKPESCVRGAGAAWQELKEAFKALRAFKRLEKQNRRRQ